MSLEQGRNEAEGKGKTAGNYPAITEVGAGTWFRLLVIKWVLHFITVEPGYFSKKIRAEDPEFQILKDTWIYPRTD
jgi:hypothetical protein